MKKVVYTLIAAVTLSAIAAYFVFACATNNEQTTYIYIDRDDNIDSVVSKVEHTAQPATMLGFQTMAKLTKYDEHIRTGRYEVEPGMPLVQLFRHLRNHNEVPVNLVVPSVRTLNELIAKMADKLMIDARELDDALASLEGSEGWTNETLPALFIPDTYEVYWDVAADDLVQRMKKEYERFWNDERKQKAAARCLTQMEVSVLASIVDSESAYNPEKPRIAGLYLNRLHADMPLQSDPTVIFAIGNFSIRRVLHAQLAYDSPYNTYKHQGLPPGPIRIPSKAGLESVLNAEKHSFLYMCAKEDFSGSHNFATTYAEHTQNARRYAQALNKRGIKK